MKVVIPLDDAAADLARGRRQGRLARADGQGRATRRPPRVPHHHRGVPPVRTAAWPSCADYALELAEDVAPPALNPDS